jgi:hypothetical protein
MFCSLVYIELIQFYIYEEETKILLSNFYATTIDVFHVDGQVKSDTCRSVVFRIHYSESVPTVRKLRQKPTAQIASLPQDLQGLSCSPSPKSNTTFIHYFCCISAKMRWLLITEQIAILLG